MAKCSLAVALALLYTVRRNRSTGRMLMKLDFLYQVRRRCVQSKNLI